MLETVDDRSTLGRESSGVDRGRMTAELIQAIAGGNSVPDVGRSTYPVTVPFDGTELGRLPLGTATDVREAVEIARRVQRPWAARRFEERAETRSRTARRPGRRSWLRRRSSS